MPYLGWSFDRARTAFNRFVFYKNCPPPSTCTAASELYVAVELVVHFLEELSVDWVLSQWAHFTVLISIFERLFVKWIALCYQTIACLSWMWRWCIIANSWMDQEPHAGSGTISKQVSLMSCDSVVDFDTVYVYYLYYFSFLTFPILFFSSFFSSYLSLTFQNMHLLRGHAGGCRRRPNLALVCLLWSPYGIGQTIYIFMLYFVLLCFPRVISAATDWMSAMLPHMVWP